PLELSSFIMTQSPYERPVTRSVSALLTGSSRQRLNGFIADWTGTVLVPVDCAGFRQTFVRRCQSIGCSHDAASTTCSSHSHRGSSSDSGPCAPGAEGGARFGFLERRGDPHISDRAEQ